MQMSAEMSDPAGAARPIGYRVSGNSFDARYAPGIRAHTIDMALWMNDHIDIPIQLK